MPKSPDDLEGLKAERAAADRAYNDALTQLDAALQKLPANLPARLAQHALGNRTVTAAAGGR